MNLTQYFAGITFNAPVAEDWAPAVTQVNLRKQAAQNTEYAALEKALASEARDMFADAVKAGADRLVQLLRENDDYAFDALEADMLGMHGEAVRPLMAKLAAYCNADGWTVKRASAASSDKLVDDPNGLIPLCLQILEDTQKVKAAQDVMSAPNNGPAAAGVTGAPLVVAKPKTEEITLKSGAETETAEPDIEEQLLIGKPPPYYDVHQEAEDFDVRPPRKDKRPGKPPRIDPAKMEEDKNKAKAPAGGHGIGDLASAYSGVLDNAAGQVGGALKGPALASIFDSNNRDQKKVDNSMQDAQHVALLQNLLSTDEILAEADPEKVVGIFNTIRHMAPQLAGDVNVMRVLLRSAVQHEGISPFDLKGILETELGKQKVDVGQSRMADNLYKGKPLISDKQ